MATLKRIATMLHAATSKTTTTSSSTTLETSTASDSETIRTKIDCASAYEFYNLLRQNETVNWCDWHLIMSGNDNAIKIAKNFHQDFEKQKLSSSIDNEIDVIDNTFLQFKPLNDERKKIKSYLKQACEEDSPLLIIKAYTVSQEFSGYINKNSAANTYHALKLYCTLLNCPILAHTQEFTEAITSIFFHPKLDVFLVRKQTVYRGIVLEDDKFINSYKEGAIIITTTFLATSTDSQVAESFCVTASRDQVSIFCIYNIDNVHRRTALDLTSLSDFGDEQEILILRYIPFTIKSVERTDDGQRMRICFDECKDYSEA